MDNQPSSAIRTTKRKDTDYNKLQRFMGAINSRKYTEMPSNTNALKNLRKLKLAEKYLTIYSKQINSTNTIATSGKTITKRQFARDHGIGIDTLNKGLRLMNIETNKVSDRSKTSFDTDNVNYTEPQVLSDSSRYNRELSGSSNKKRPIRNRSKSKSRNLKSKPRPSQKINRRSMTIRGGSEYFDNVISDNDTESIKPQSIIPNKDQFMNNELRQDKMKKADEDYLRLMGRSLPNAYKNS